MNNSQIEEAKRHVGFYLGCVIAVLYMGLLPLKKALTGRY